MEARAAKNLQEQEMIEKVRGVFEENKQVYGYRKMHNALVKDGVDMSVYRVRKIMRENGMFPVVMKKYRPTHNGKHDGRYLDNLLEQDFTAAAPNRVWAGDITYIKTKLGFVYLAVVLDLFNKEIIGYSIDKCINAELATAALENAIIRSGKKHEDTIFHSDRGCQYSSKAYQEALEKAHITGSMSRPACPYDNACSESFFSVAKRECIYRKNYDTMEEVKRDLFEYIELFYNRKRIHACLGYMSPVEYRLKHTA